MRTLLTKREVAILLGKCTKTIERMTPRFQTQLSGKRGRNGKEWRLYHLELLPAEAQRKWRAKQGIVDTKAVPEGRSKQLERRAITTDLLRAETSLIIAAARISTLRKRLEAEV